MHAGSHHTDAAAQTGAVAASTLSTPKACKAGPRGLLQLPRHVLPHRCMLRASQRQHGVLVQGQEISHQAPVW
jgi:hypothetical protein